MNSLVSESNEEALNINSMRDEILTKIFGCLSHNELGQIAQVCRRWNALTKSPVLWEKVDAHFLSYNPQFQATALKCFLNLLPPCVTVLTLKFNGFFGEAEPLNFEAICVKLQEKCQHLETLELCSTKLSQTLPSVINLCTKFLQNIKILLFRLCKFSKHPAKDECVDISKVEVLEFFWCELGNCKPPFSTMPHLTDLKFSFMNVDNSWFEDDPSFLNQLHVLDLGSTWIGPRAFEAIWNHACNLKELYMCFTRFEDEDFNNAVFSNLKTICFSSCQDVSWFDVVALVRSCQSLQNVYVSEDVFKYFDDPSYVVGNVCMSEILKLSNKEMHHHIM